MRSTIPTLVLCDSVTRQRIAVSLLARYAVSRMLIRSIRFFRLVAPILLLAMGGMLLRLWLAPMVAQVDINAFRSWMETGVKLGVVRSYSEQVSSPWLTNYPPVGMYLITASGYLYKWLASPEFSMADPTYMVFTKLPALLSDVVTACLLLLFFVKLRRKRLGLIAATIYLLHPAVLYESALWGQMDSLSAMFAMGALTAAVWKKPSLAMMIAVLGMFTKPQGIIFVPLFLFLLPAKPKPLLRAFALSAAAVIVVLLPFLLAGKTGDALGVFNLDATLKQTHISWNAFNVWWAALGPELSNAASATSMLGFVTYRHAGILLFGTLYLILLLAHRKQLRGDLSAERNAATLSCVAGLIAYGMFMLAPEMHERYLFPYLALALPHALLRLRVLLLYVTVSVLYLLNLMHVFSFMPWQTHMLAWPLLSGPIIAMAQTFVFFLTVAALTRWDQLRLELLSLSKRCAHIGKRIIDNRHFTVSVLVLLGFLLRLIVALHPGYGFDVGTNQGWAWTGAVNGVTTSYTEQLDGTMIPDYPPFSLMLFTGVGEVYRLFAAEREAHPLLFRLLIKLPSITCDLLIIVTLYFLLTWLKNKRAGMLAALIAALHPAIWYDSSAWGQTDVIFTLFVLLSLLSLGWNHAKLGGTLGALALFTKVHAIAFYPLFLIATRLRWKSILQAIAGGLFAFALIFTPFFLAGTGMQALDAFIKVIGSYHMVSANGYNFWWALLDQAAWDRQDTLLLLGPLTYRHVGLLLVLLSYTLVLWPLYRLLRTKATNRVITEALLAAAAVCAFAFFLFNTEMHERYLFPFTVFGLPLVFFHRSYWLSYWGATSAFLLNLMSFLRAPDAIGWLFDTFPTIDSAIASLQVVLFVLLLIRVRRYSLRVPPLRSSPLGTLVRTWYARTRLL